MDVFWVPVVIESIASAPTDVFPLPVVKEGILKYPTLVLLSKEVPLYCLIAP